jgi:lipopolysaccharide/colanic/teichoic acid biosynthesis glycosyltransferase
MFLIRMFDIILSLICIIVFSPFYLIISIIIFFDNSGPIFFSQKRVTINQKLFNFIKFRSMKNSSSSNTGDNENYLTMDLEELKKIRDNYVTTKSGDRRVTNVGKVLRKTSLDEIPQFFSVLKGDMSMAVLDLTLQSKRQTTIRLFG